MSGMESTDKGSLSPKRQPSSLSKTMRFSEGAAHQAIPLNSCPAPLPPFPMNFFLLFLPLEVFFDTAISMSYCASSKEPSESLAACCTSSILVGSRRTPLASESVSSLSVTRVPSGNRILSLTMRGRSTWTNISLNQDGDVVELTT